MSSPSRTSRLAEINADDDLRDDGATLRDADRTPIFEDLEEEIAQLLCPWQYLQTSADRARGSLRL